MNKEIIEEFTDRGVVKQSHSLNQAKFKMSALALDMFYLLLTEVTNKDRDMKYYNVSFRDLEIKLGKQIDRRYIDKALKELRVTDIEIDTGREKPLYSTLCASSEEISDGVYELEISSKLKAHVLSTEGEFPFSLTDFKQLTKIGSSYGKRIYSLLKQFEGKDNHGWYKVKVSDLKGILDVASKYKSYSDFKKRVLNTALKHINENTNMTVNMVEIKKGRSVVSLNFTFRSIKEKKTTRKVETKNKDLDILGEWANNLEPEVIDAEVLEVKAIS